MEGLLDKVKDNIRNKISNLNYNTWFKQIQKAQLEGDIYTLFVPNRFVADWITDYYADLLEKEITSLMERPVRLRFEISEGSQTQGSQTQGPADFQEKNTTTHVTPVLETSSIQKQRPIISSFSLNPKSSFDTFVVGSGNQLAHAAAKAVSELPGRHYNPLFLYGGVGLGKTHLLNAIGLELHRRHPDFKIIYMSSEKFMNELINGIRFDRMAEFRKKYRESCDILLIDDIQFIAGKERTQDEFFHTFNTLYDAQRQIVLTSDKSPKEIPGLEDRLRSRFEWGLIADVQAPDMETRAAILRKKSDSSNIRLRDDVILFLAMQLKGNVRELEGALIRLQAFAELAKSPITIDLAKGVIQNLFKHNSPTAQSIESIQKAVADYYNVRVEDLKSTCRVKGFAHPRQVAMYLCRKYLKRSFPEIGSNFGGKDHTTVMHACKKVERVLMLDTHLRNELELIEKLLTN